MAGGDGGSAVTPSTRHSMLPAARLLTWSQRPACSRLASTQTPKACAMLAC